MSAQYIGTIPVRVQIGGHRITTLPSNTDSPGTYWPGFRLRSSGAVIPLILIGERQSRITSTHQAAWVISLAATPLPLARDVPARRACGKPTDYLLPTARTR